MFLNAKKNMFHPYIEMSPTKGMGTGFGTDPVGVGVTLSYLQDTS